MFKQIRLLVQALIYDDDVPMDTKTVCGILYLSMHVIENGEDSWMSVSIIKFKRNTIIYLFHSRDLVFETYKLCL